MVKITSMPEVYSLVDELREECRRHRIERVTDALDNAMALGSSGLEILGAIRSVLVRERDNLVRVVDKKTATAIDSVIEFAASSFGESTNLGP